MSFHCLFTNFTFRTSLPQRGGRVARKCWVIFQCRGVLLIWRIGQGPIEQVPIEPAVGAGVVWTCFSFVYLFFVVLWETARYRLKYCIKRLLNPKQPANQPLQQCILHVPPKVSRGSKKSRVLCNTERIGSLDGSWA